MTATVYDNFLPDAHAVREDALASEYVDWHGHDGEVYKRICIKEIPGLRSAIERAMGGPVDMLGMAYRLNYRGELPNAAIHSDLGWGTHALVLYLSRDYNGSGGTAFWRHLATGAERIDPGDTELFESVRGDWNDRSAWEIRRLVPIRFNRALIYESAWFHSRYPFEAFGDSPENGRLIAVAFFTPRPA